MRPRLLLAAMGAMGLLLVVKLGAVVTGQPNPAAEILVPLALLWHFKSMSGLLSRRYADRNRSYVTA
jgi:hypothetical protein